MNLHKRFFTAVLAIGSVLIGGCEKQSSQLKTTEAPKKVGIFLLASHPVINDLRDGFRERLQQLASEKGQSIEFDEKNADGNAAQVNQLTAYFSRGTHPLVYAVGSDTALKLKSRESTTAVIFAGTPDPVRNGFVDSLEKPGGNLTGARFLPPAKIILDILQKAHPDLKKLAVLRNPAEVNSVSVVEPFITEAKARHLEVGDFGLTESSQLPAVLGKIRSEGWQAVFIPTDNLVYQNLKQVSASLNEAKIPFVSVTDSAVKAGAEFSIGVSYKDVGRKCAEVAAHVLFDGKKPQDVPVLDIQEGKLYVSKANADKFSPWVPVGFPLTPLE